MPDLLASAGSRSPGSDELHPGPGFRIRRDFHRLDQDTVAGFAEFGHP